MAGKKGVGASAPTQINIQGVEELVGITVGPDEVLVLRVPDLGSEYDKIVAETLDYLTEIGLKDRVVIVSGDVEMAVVKKDG